jgi:hypothetical protein
MLRNSYMLRFWRANHGESWRVTLISISPDATEQHFTTVKDLLIYLGRLYASSLWLSHDTPSTTHEIDATT